MKNIKSIFLLAWTNIWIILLLLFAIFLILRQLLGMGQMVYGDIPYFDPKLSSSNALYAWGESQLGTNVRQGLNTLRDVLIDGISVNGYMYFFVKYLLPIVLIPANFFFWIRKMGVGNKYIVALASLLSLANPVFFGDFLTGQSLWVYLPLPWVYYFIIEIFYFQRISVRNSLSLVLLFFLTFGMLPPIIVPLFLTCAMLVVVTSMTRWEYIRPKLTKYLLHGLLTVLAFMALGFPYLFIASSGQAAYTPPSLISDYRNNYAQTTFLNTFRLSGNEGNGQKTLNYNAFSLTNALGYVLLILVVLGIYMMLKAKNRDMLPSLILLIVMLLSLGFLNLVSVNQDIGMRLFKSQWLVASIRNPTKIYVVLLPLFIFLFAMSIKEIHKSISKERFRKLFLAGILVSILAYGWPLLRGDLGLFYNKDEIKDTYRKDETVLSIAKDSRDEVGRSILIPSTHRDELNYENIGPNLNTFKLEGGLPKTGELTQSIRSSFAANNEYFFNYLRAAGVSNLYVKKDSQNLNLPSRFSLFSTPQRHDEILEFLSKGGMTIEGQDDRFTELHIDSNELVYSPSRIVQVKDRSDFKSKAPFLDAGTAVLDTEPKLGLSADTYYWKQSITEQELEGEGLAQLYDPSLVLSAVTAVPNGSGSKVEIAKYDPFETNKETVFSLDAEAEDKVLSIDEDIFFLGASEERKIISAGKHEIKIGNTEPAVEKFPDPSFEAEEPFAGDASIRKEGEPQIYTGRSDDARDGSYSALLGSNNHTAFISKAVRVEDFGQPHFISFDFKNIKGASLRYAILQNDKVINTSKNLQKSSDWQTANVFISSDVSGDEDLSIYFYTDGEEGGSENLIDNITLQKVAMRDAGEIDIEAYESDYELDGLQVAPSVDERPNLVNNPSFEAPDLWGLVGDATAGAPGEPEISARQSDEAYEGEHALELRSSNHTAFVSQNIQTQTVNTIFKVSFMYRNVKGAPLSFAVWQGGANVSDPYIRLPAASDWTYYETYFVPQKEAKDLTLFFYSPYLASESINLVDAVSVQESSLISNYLVKSAAADRGPDAMVESFTRINPTLLEVEVNSNDNLLVFNESYHKGWRAYVVNEDFKASHASSLTLQSSGKELPPEDHIMVNGFANGWWVSGLEENEKIILFYEPQRTMYIGLIISLSTLMAILVYIVVSKSRTSKWKSGN